MTSEQFIQVAKQDECIQKFIGINPNANNDVKRFAHSTAFKLLLVKAGSKIIDILITLLQNILIKKYA